ncbi:MAG: hypothetical protein AAF683_09740, partial [Pseudomonadota bacterium]
MRLRILATAGLLAITTGFVAPALAQRSTIEAPEASSGLETYAEPSDAVKAGDIAAFMGFLKADEDYEIVSSSFRAMLLSIDAIAEENYQAAREALNDVR